MDAWHFFIFKKIIIQEDDAQKNKWLDIYREESFWCPIIWVQQLRNILMSILILNIHKQKIQKKKKQRLKTLWIRNERERNQFVVKCFSSTMLSTKFLCNRPQRVFQSNIHLGRDLTWRKPQSLSKWRELS